MAKAAIRTIYLVVVIAMMASISVLGITNIIPSLLGTIEQVDCVVRASNYCDECRRGQCPNWDEFAPGCTGIDEPSMEACGITLADCSSECINQGFAEGTCRSGGTTSTGNVNGIWCSYGDLSQTFLDRLVAGKINQVYLFAAHWGGWGVPGDGQVLTADVNDAEINDFISQVKAANPNIKVFAWIWSQIGLTDPQPDLSTQSSRQQLVDQVVNFIVSKGFDGVQDDTEGWTTYPKWEDQTAYFNQLQTAIHAAGKTLLAYEVPYRNQMAYLNVDYQMMYQILQYTDDLNYDNLVHIFTTYDPIATSPYVLNILGGAENHGHPEGPLSQQLANVDRLLAEHGPYPKFQGYGIYIYSSMTDADWDVWNNWKTKDGTSLSAAESRTLSLSPGSVYHVSTAGSDSNSGTQSSPWKTITKAANSASAGDTVYVHEGVYREGSIKPANSGTETDPIVFMAYGYDQGSLDDVLITGADKVSSWSHFSGNVYYKDLGYITYQVFQNDEKLEFESDGRGSLGAGEWWLDKNSKRLYVYVKDKGSGHNPNNYDMGVSRRTGGFVLDSRKYIHVKGFRICCFNPTIRDWGPYNGVTYKLPRGPAVSIFMGHNNVVEGNTIYHLVLGKSIKIWGGSYNRIEDNEVYNVQGDGIGVGASQDGSRPSEQNVIIYNEVYNMNDYGGLEILSGGPKPRTWMSAAGITVGADNSENNKVSFNSVHHNQYVGIWLDVGPWDTLIRSNEVYSNPIGIFIESRPHQTEVVQNIVYDNTQIGLLIGGHGNLGPSYDSKIYNNVVYRNREGMVISKARDNDFKNNLFFDNTQGAIFVHTSDGSVEALKNALSGNTFDYNLYHGGGGSDPDTSNQFWWGNLRYSEESKTADKTLSEFQSSSNQEENSLNRNPQLVNPPSDFHLKSISPAIDAGAEISLSLMDLPDYTGVAQDIGAFEFGVSNGNGDGVGTGCLSGETAISDTCDAGYTCCCSGTAPPPTTTENIFSASIWTGASDYYLEKAKELGVGWVRIGNGGNWKIIEYEKGKYHWDSADRIVNWAKANGIKPYISVTYTPEWARPPGTSPKHPPTNMDDYKNFVYTIVNRYDLDVVNLWNGEPRGFFAGTEDEWVALIRAGYEGAKEANPNIIVAAGYGYSLSHIYEGPFALDTLVEKGFLNYVDALDVHTYTGNTHPEDILPTWLSDIREYLESKGYPDMDLYASEYGYAIAPGIPAGGTHTLEEQADWAVKHAEILSNDPYVKLVNYWVLHDGREGDLCALINPDTKELRPVYYAYKDFIAEATRRKTTGVWYGVGDNWNLYTTTESELINEWNKYINNVLKPWNFKVVRLEMTFGPPSTRTGIYLDGRLEALLQLLDSHGIKAVIDFHNYRDLHGFAGSQQWKDQWLQFVQQWKNDPRIIAYELFNEPFESAWHSSISDGHDLAYAFADLTDKIRAIDSTTKIVWADPWYFSRQVDYPDKVGGTSPIPEGAERPNIVWAVHTWLPNSDWNDMVGTINGKGKVIDYWRQLYPDATMWLGEFGGYWEYDFDVQREFVLRAINLCMDKQIGFSMWYIRSHNRMDTYEPILEESDYHV